MQRKIWNWQLTTKILSDFTNNRVTYAAEETKFLPSKATSITEHYYNTQKHLPNKENSRQMGSG